MLLGFKGVSPVKALAANLNGISIAYIMGAVNATLSMLLAFGININEQQQAAIFAFVNACLVILAHVSHRVGENEQAIKHAPSVDAPPAKQ